MCPALDSHPVSWYGVTFFRGNDGKCHHNPGNKLKIISIGLSCPSTDSGRTCLAIRLLRSQLGDAYVEIVSNTN